jgi:hypothetical protein
VTAGGTIEVGTVGILAQSSVKTKDTKVFKMKLKTGLLFLALSLLLFCGACRSTLAAVERAASNTMNPIDLVKHGILPGYTSTTVGKAFEGTFQDSKWTVFESAKGATVVQFDGTIPLQTVREAGFFVFQHQCETGTCSVTFQFRLSADHKSFSPAYVEQRVFFRDGSYKVRDPYRQNVTHQAGSIDPAGEDQIFEFIYR